jgi:hypothetical protein
MPQAAAAESDVSPSVVCAPLVMSEKQLFDVNIIEPPGDNAFTLIETVVYVQIRFARCAVMQVGKQSGSKIIFKTVKANQQTHTLFISIYLY